MCSLASVVFVEQLGNERSEYYLDAYGMRTSLARTISRLEPRNIEQWIWKTWEDVNGPAPYLCSCGRGFSGWLEAVDHCDMYVCRSCQKATRKWDGWDYRCRDCDVASNPD